MQVVLYLLDMHNAIYSDTRKNPAKVARAITEMVSLPSSRLRLDVLMHSSMHFMGDYMHKPGQCYIRM